MEKNINRKHFLLNLISAYGNTFVSIFIGIISVNMALSYWKTEKYGIWTIITSLAVYLSVSGLGIDVASGLLMTKNSEVKIKKTIFKRGFFLLAGSTILISGLIILLYLINPNWLKILGKMTSENFKEAKITATIFIIFFLINLPFGIITNSFAAYEKAYLSSMFNTVSVILNFFALIATVFFKFSLPIYGMIYGTITLILNLIKAVLYYKVSKNYKKISNIEQTEIKDSNYKTIITMGIRLTLYGITVLISTNITNLIISNKLGVAQVVPYSLAYRLLYIAFTFLYTINIASAPLLGKEYGNRNWEWIKKSYNNLFIITVFISGLIFIGAVLFIKDILNLWVGANNFVGMPALIFMGIWFFIGGLSNINYMIINSFNFTKGIVYASWSEMIIFIVTAIFCVNKMGVSGVTFGMALGAVLVPSWILPFIIYKKSEGKLKYNYKYFIKSIIIIFMIIIISIYIQIKIEDVFIRIFISIIMILLYMIFSFKFFPEETKISITKRVKNLLLNTIKIKK